MHYYPDFTEHKYDLKRIRAKKSNDKLDLTDPITVREPSGIL